MRSCRYKNIYSVVLLIAMGVSIQSRAESTLCHALGGGPVREAVAAYGDPADVLGGQVQKLQTVKHAALRAILAIERCPESAERALSQGNEATTKWQAALRSVLEPYFALQLTPMKLDGLAESIVCAPGTPHVCEIKRVLMEHSGVESARYRQEDTCQYLGPTLMSETSSDFGNSTGDFLGQMENLAFLLFACPDGFWAYMHDHPKEFEHWLSVSKDEIFWGDTGDFSALKAYKAALIDFVARQDTVYTVEKDKVLQVLKDAQVRITE